MNYLNFPIKMIKNNVSPVFKDVTLMYFSTSLNMHLIEMVVYKLSHHLNNASCSSFDIGYCHHG